MSKLWTDEKLKRVVTDGFITSCLPAEDTPTLKKLLGDGPQDGNYMDRIKDRAPRMFLILVQVGAAHRIFNVIDQAYDDEDLPLSVADISRLNLSADRQDDAVEDRFVRAQPQFLAPAMQTGAPKGGSKSSKESRIIIEVVSNESEDTDIVRLKGNKAKIFTRRRIVLRKAPTFVHGDDFADDIRFIFKKLAHQHFVSIKSAYILEGVAFVLYRPILSLHLRAFLQCPPTPFKALQIRYQQSNFLNWPHCLASAILFLHEQKLYHGDISPFNIFIDPMNRIYLGFSVHTPSIKTHANVLPSLSSCYDPPEQEVMQPLPDLSSFQQSSSKRGIRKLLSSAGSVRSSNAPTFISGKSSSSGSSSVHTLSSPTESSMSHRPSIDDAASIRALPTIPTSPRPDAPAARPDAASIKGLARSGSKAASSTNIDPIAQWQARSRPDTTNAPQILQQGDVFSLGCVCLDILDALLIDRPASTPFHARRERKSRFFSPGHHNGAGAHSHSGVTPQAAMNSTHHQTHHHTDFHSETAVATHLDELERIANAATTDPVQSLQQQAMFRGVPPVLNLVRQMLQSEPELRPSMMDVVKNLERALLEVACLPYLHCGGASLC